ncbi:hypothetical protein MBLNU457_g2686t1 [Dothideomycetes sp. NU457]
MRRSMPVLADCAVGAQIKHDEHPHNLIDVDSPHISEVPSDYKQQEYQTETQAERHRLEEEAKEKRKEAEKKAEEVKRQAGIEKEKAKEQAQKAEKVAKDNSDNPVVIGNAVTIAALGGLLGFGAYRKYTAGELTWKVAGLWAGAVGLFGVADYFVSSYFFKKYPAKR